MEEYNKFLQEIRKILKAKRRIELNDHFNKRLQDEIKSLIEGKEDEDEDEDFDE